MVQMSLDLFGTGLGVHLFVGDYRRASVVHDYYCYPANRNQNTSKQVHRMFYEAMLCDGVKKRRAKKIYKAVVAKEPGGPIQPKAATKFLFDHKKRTV